MKTNFPTFRLRGLVGVAPASVALATLVSAGWIKQEVEIRRHAAVGRTFQASRPSLVERIRVAEETKDLSALEAMRSAFSGRVSDPEFFKLLDEGRARLRTLATLNELAAARRLDLARHHEETRLEPDATRPQVDTRADHQGQALSVLPL